MTVISAKRKTPAAQARGAGRPRRFTHEQIVDAALEVMEREGFAALTLASLAARMKVSHSVLYKYVGNIEEVEAEALQRLAATIPMPRAGTAKDIRAQAIACLLALREVLLKHPGVLYPPTGSSAWATFRECVVQWVLVLKPYAASVDAAVAGHTALVAMVALNAEIARHHGVEGLSRMQQLKETRVPAPKSLQQSLEHLIDSLFPGFAKAK